MINKHKKIFFIYLNAFSSTGGIEEFNKKFIESLEQITVGKHIKVELISIYDKQEEYQPRNKNIKFLGFSGNKLKSIIHIVQNVRKEDMLFYGHINLLPIAFLTYFFNRVKNTFFIIHGIDAWHRFPLIKRNILKKFSFLAVSNYTKNIFSAKNNVDLTKIIIFPNCIYLESDILLPNNPYNPSNFNLLSVTRLSQEDNYKGVDHILEAVSLLKDEIPNIKYTIVGKGNDLNRLMEISKKLNILRYVDFKGYVENIEPYFAHCDLFCLPSKSEGFGIVYLEAMKYKKPILAANSAGAVDVVLDNKTGFLCEYGDIKCIADKIQIFSQNKILTNKFGKLGYERLYKNFTFNSFKLRLENILLGGKLK